jgi:hypothetical protein
MEIRFQFSKGIDSGVIKYYNIYMTKLMKLLSYLFTLRSSEAIRNPIHIFLIC